jgi:hypothetical protein
VDVNGSASRAGALYGPERFLAGLVAVRTAPRLLCGQCRKMLDDADADLTCYCKDVQRAESEDEPL